MIDIASVGPEIKKEALDISEEILKDMEENEILLSKIALKTLRLAILLNDSDYMKIFEYELYGYPSTKEGITAEVWKLAVMARRTYKEKDGKIGEEKEYASTKTLIHLEEDLIEARAQCEKFPESPLSYVVTVTAFDPGKFARSRRRELLDQLAGRSIFIHDYASKKYYELKFSNATNNAFSRIQGRVDSKIDLLVPRAVQRFAVIYDYLRSDKPEQWSDAVHDCRRILKDLADALFPPQPQPRTKLIQGKKKEIRLDDENIINRLVCFVDDNSESESFKILVGSHLDFMGDRLGSIYHATNKGSHTDITSREEADRYVVYTYMIVGDILSLLS